MKYLLIVIILLAAQTAFAQTTFYVNKTTGSDSNSCTQAQSTSTPRATIKQGVDCLNNATADVLRIQPGSDGIYNEGIDPQNLGDPQFPTGTSWSNAATIQSDTTLITMRPPSAYDSVGILLYDVARYIIFKDLIMDGVNAGTICNGFKITQDAHHIRFQNVEIKNFSRSGVLVSHAGDVGILEDSNEFLNCVVHDNQTAGPGHALYISTNFNLVEGCTLYNSGNWGIQFWDEGGDNIVRNNVIRNNDSGGIVIGAGSNHLIYNNVIYDNNFSGIYIVNNNDAVGSSSIYNNTLFSNGQYGVEIDAADPPSSAWPVTNNIAYQNSSGAFLNTGSLLTLTTNLTTDPTFVNAGTFDFHIQTSSAAKDAGTSLSGTFTTDKDGNTRPQGAAWDIGAYEFVQASAARAMTKGLLVLKGNVVIK